MFERDYLRNVRRELLARGIWGSSARRLTEQLSDHGHETVAALVAKGREAGAAQKEALEILGSPGTVAKAAAESLREQSVLARHPWWMGGTAFIAVFAATILLAFLGFSLSGFTAYVETGNVKDLHLTTLSVFAFLANWLPLAMAMLGLGWTAWKKPAGWAPLMIVCAAIGLAAGAMTVHIVPPIYGPHSGSFYVAGESWLALLLWPIVKQFSWRAFLGFSVLKLILPCAICAVLRRTLHRFNQDRDQGSLSHSQD